MRKILVVTLDIGSLTAGGQTTLCKEMPELLEWEGLLRNGMQLQLELGTIVTQFIVNRVRWYQSHNAVALGLMPLIPLLVVSSSSFDETWARKAELDLIHQLRKES